MSAPGRPMPSIAATSWQRFIVELRQFYRIPEQAFFVFSLPLILLFLFALIFSGIEIEGPPGEDSIDLASYFVAGMIAVGVMTSTFQYLAISISIEQHEGLLKRLGGTPLPRAAYFFGKIGLALVITVVQGGIMLVFGLIVVGIDLPTDPARWAVLAAVIALGTACFSLLGIAYTRFIPSQKAAGPMVILPYLVLQFISGIFFVLSDIPAGLRIIASIFPLRWLAQGLRYVFLPDWFKAEEPGGTWSVEWVLVILAVWTVISFAAAIMLFRWSRAVDR